MCCLGIMCNSGLDVLMARISFLMVTHEFGRSGSSVFVTHYEHTSPSQ
jgi:hypothetical protein